MSTWRQFLTAYACPRDKHILRIEAWCLACDECGTQYLTDGGYPDFRLHPEHSRTDGSREKWERLQKAYEKSEFYADVEAELASG